MTWVQKTVKKIITFETTSSKNLRSLL